MKITKKKQVTRKAFICANCSYVYCDAHPTSCDCTVGKKTRFLRGKITYEKP